MPAGVYCTFCMTYGHAKSDHPFTGQIFVRTDYAPTPDDHAADLEAVSHRMIAYRVFAGQLTRLLREAGIAIPPDVQALSPEPEL